MKKYKKPKKAKNRTAVRNQAYHLLQIEDPVEFDKAIEQMSEEEAEACLKELYRMSSIEKAKAEAMKAKVEHERAKTKFYKTQIQKQEKQIQEKKDEALILASQIDLIHR